MEKQQILKKQTVFHSPCAINQRTRCNFTAGFAIYKIILLYFSEFLDNPAVCIYYYDKRNPHPAAALPPKYGGVQT